MFAIGIRYLNDWALATHPSSREHAEWPPHPDRVFMALAAAHFETEGVPAERAALEWLEALPPPSLHASLFVERNTGVSYVPVNDTVIAREKDNAQKLQKRLERVGATTTLSAAKDVGLTLLPEFRSRQPRRFPVAVPDNSIVYLIWEIAAADCARHEVLEGLCQKVTYIGHSASLVQCWIERQPPRATLVPCSEFARHRLRIAGAGRLMQLQRAFEAGRRPNPSLWSGYATPRIEVPANVAAASVFAQDVLILRRVEGPALPLQSTLSLIGTLRDTLMSKCPQQPPPEWFSGHRADGTPSANPHLAFFPLPFVGHEHSDGHILGLGIAMPKMVDAGMQEQCFRDVLYDELGHAQAIELRMGKMGLWKVILEDREVPLVALRRETWSPEEPCSRWATVTPIVFDRHPNLSAEEKKALGEGASSSGQRLAREQTALALQAEKVVQSSCKRIGLPEPQVVLSPVSMFPGTPHARSFPCLQRKSGGNLHHTHAILIFAEPVHGPLLLGAGRYRGYGLCCPLRNMNS